ncbi:MAG TPA: hypothetical protein VKT77_23120, partial [Chthonomonadaceae bacterium]|nr:hypothetical protein [Chthonomonadaceae bacterium]
MRSAQVPDPESEFIARGGPGERGAKSRDMVLIVASCVVVPLAIAYGFGVGSELHIAAAVVGLIFVILTLAYP